MSCLHTLLFIILTVSADASIPTGSRRWSCLPQCACPIFSPWTVFVYKNLKVRKYDTYLQSSVLIYLEV